VVAARFEAREGPVNPVPDELLLTTAQISATLIGLLLIGVYFYLETGFRRLTAVRSQAGAFLRATTKLTLLFYSLVLGLSLALVALHHLWAVLVYLFIGAGVIPALVSWTRRYRDLRRVVPIPRDSPFYLWPAVVLMLAIPWVADGVEPTREALTWTLLVAGVLAFLSTAGMLLTSFDLAAFDKAARSDGVPTGDET
jgi:hypothetical protein